MAERLGSCHDGASAAIDRRFGSKTNAQGPVKGRSRVERRSARPGPEFAWRHSIVLFEHVGEARCALEAGFARDPLDCRWPVSQRVDRAGKATIDQISIRRSPSRRAKAANEMMFGKRRQDERDRIE